MREITHCRYEAIRERGHMADASLLCPFSHLPCFRKIHGEWLLTKHMLARRDGCQRNRCMKNVRRGNNDRLYIVTPDDLLKVCRDGRNTSLLPGAFKRDRISVTQRCDF